MNIKFTELKNEDLPIVKEIYDHYILNSTVTFHTSPILIKELEEFIPIGIPKYKSFLIKTDVEVCGYCYFSQYKKRTAYNRTAEITIYLKHGFPGKGIGEKAVIFIENLAKETGIKVLIAGITSENQLSINLFEKCSYKKCAHLKQVGEKFGKILDVVYYQKFI